MESPLYPVHRHLLLPFTFIRCQFIQYGRCLAHVINLATQALLATYSKAKYYEPGMFEIDDDFGIPGIEGVWRDEIGLIRAIAVKVVLINDSQMLSKLTLLIRFDPVHSGRRCSRRSRSLPISRCLET